MHEGITISIIFSVGVKIVQGSFNIVTDDMKLTEASVESLGGGQIGDIAETEDIAEFIMLEGELVNIKETVAGSEACISQESVGLLLEKGVQVVVGSLTFLAGFYIFENGGVGFLFDFHQLQSVLDVNVALFEFGLDKAVSSCVVVAESVVGIDDCESRVLPTQHSSGIVAVPEVLGQEEVVVLNLPVEGSWGNIKDGLSSLEIVKISKCLGC